MQKYKSNITTTSGDAVRGVPVLVIKEDGSNAALFLDRAGTVSAPNPLTTGPDGVFYFYAVNGRYSLRTTVDGVTITDDDVVLMMDPEEITVAGPIAEAVAAAQAAAIAAEFAVEDSGIPDLVAAAQNAVVDSNNAVIQANSAANNAAISKTGADSARDDAVIAKNSAEAALDSFDDRYLGAKASAPATDNDGGALLTGALYWDTALPGMRSWNGSVWVTLPAATKASVGLANVDNTSDAAKSVLSATKLTTARTINGVYFDGSANISIKAVAIPNTPAGSIAATTVQAAINELDVEKQSVATLFNGDLNTLKTSGTYFGDFWTNGPGGLAFGTLDVIARSASSVTQHITLADPSISISYRRHFYSGTTWSPWRRIYDQSTILGTVSQSAGVPTGAVMEYGSNANGQFWKFAGGLLVCTFETSTTVTTTPSGSVHSVTFAGWTYPHAYAVGPWRGCAADGTVVWANVRASSPNTSGVVAVHSAIAFTSAPLQLSLVAVGRWY